MTWKSYAVVSGAGLAITYLFSTPMTVDPDRAPAPRVVAGQPAPPVFDIQEQASRLQTQVRPHTEYEPPNRNPFRFGAQPAPTSRRATTDDPIASEELADVVPEVPAPPLVRLSGVVVNTVDGVRQRSAVLVTAAGIVTVREGDTVGGDYRVVRIEEDAVELMASDGTSRRLTLR